PARLPRSPLFAYTTLFRSGIGIQLGIDLDHFGRQTILLTRKSKCDLLAWFNIRSVSGEHLQFEMHIASIHNADERIIGGHHLSRMHVDFIDNAPNRGKYPDFTLEFPIVKERLNIYTPQFQFGPQSLIPCFQYSGSRGSFLKSHR